MEKQKQLDKRLIAVIIGLVLVIVALAGFLVYRTVTIDDNDTPLIGYATDATVLLDQDALQAAVDEAQKNAKNNQVSLMYQNEAHSTDGKTFSCFIANDAANLYDMYLTIYADSGMTDQLYLSGLIPPGSGFEKITLDHALDPGQHTVCVVVTQVDTDKETGEQVVKNQVVHTIEFYVEQ